MDTHYAQIFTGGSHPAELHYYEWTPELHYCERMPSETQRSAIRHGKGCCTDGVSDDSSAPNVMDEKTSRQESCSGRTGTSQRSSVRGVVQIVHGMAEHLGRYTDLAKYLTNHGYAVVGADHRGHGLSANKTAPLGYFGDGVRWEDLVKDQETVRRYTSKCFPHVPHILLGHSMGSFIVRSYLAHYAGKIDAAAIIGTGLWPRMAGSAGLLAAKVLSAAKPQEKGRLLNQLAFGSYNKPFSGRTNFDWLSRSSANVDSYIADPLCGYVPSNAFFAVLLSLLRAANDPQAYCLEADLPLYIASGGNDPVGGEKAVKHAASCYRAAGCSQVTSHVYPYDRHEIFNEIDRQEVWTDLENWLSQVCTAKHR